MFSFSSFPFSFSSFFFTCFHDELEAALALNSQSKSSGGFSDCRSCPYCHCYRKCVKGFHDADFDGIFWWKMDIFLTSKSAKAILLRGLRIVSKYHFQRFGFYSRSCRDGDGKIKSGVFVWNNWFRGRTSFVFLGAHLWSHISWLQAWRVKSQGR